MPHSLGVMLTDLGHETTNTLVFQPAAEIWPPVQTMYKVS